jgi:hypothetical protein
LIRENFQVCSVFNLAVVEFRLVPPSEWRKSKVSGAWPKPVYVYDKLLKLLLKLQQIWLKLYCILTKKIYPNMYMFKTKIKKIENKATVKSAASWSVWLFMVFFILFSTNQKAGHAMNFTVLQLYQYEYADFEMVITLVFRALNQWPEWPKIHIAETKSLFTLHNYAFN